MAYTRALLIASVLALSACDSGGELERRGGSKGDQKAKGQRDLDDEDDEHSADARKDKKRDKGGKADVDAEGGASGGADLGELSTGDDEAADIEYPTVTYAGSGQLTNVDRSFPVTQKIRVAIPDKETVVFEVLEATSSRREVREGLEKSIGPTRYRRASVQGKPRDDYPRSLLYVSALTKKDGATTTFADPVPLLPYQTKSRERLAPLAGGPKRFSTRATSGGQTFTVNVTVSMTGNVVSVVAEIPEDRDGTLYALSLPYKSAYHFDFAAGRIARIESDGYYHDAKRAPGDPTEMMREKLGGNLPLPAEMEAMGKKFSKRQPLKVDYALCRYEEAGNVEGPGC